MTAPASKDSFGARHTLTVGDSSHEVFRLDAVYGSERLPYSLKILLENLLRTEDGTNITADHVRALAGWDPAAEPSTEIQFTPGRVVMQDFTGVPCVVDLATMREAVTELGGDVSKVNPLAPAELVIDHSVIADIFGRPDAFERNVDLEYERNRERYQFLRWGQSAFDEFKVVPPGTGIVHQVNIEHLARVVMTRNGQAYPDTLVGTDSHTTMVNGLGVLGWGVGGIEAEAAMLGQPVSMLIPRVVGFKLNGELPAGATATDLVLTITEMLRKHGVVGKFVEFYGAGVGAVPLANRATIGNMSPEFGSTCAIFPIDGETIEYLRFTGRSATQVALVEAYAKEQGLWHDPAIEPAYSETLELDLSTVVPSIAGPKRPAGPDLAGRRQARVPWRAELVHLGRPRSPLWTSRSRSRSRPPTRPRTLVRQRRWRAGRLAHRGRGGGRQAEQPDPGDPRRRGLRARPRRGRDRRDHLVHQHVQPVGDARRRAAGEEGRRARPARKPWVKTTLAPGSKVVMDYYERAGLLPYLEKLGFHLVGYGCTTCIGNSGPLQDEISAAVNEADLAVVSVLSGNRNFEGRINPDIKMNYLASPPLVVAYALAGSMDKDITTEPLGTGSDGKPVYLEDIWPSPQEIQDVVASAISSEMFSTDYADVFAGDERWQSLPTPTGNTFEWDAGVHVRAQAPVLRGHGRGEPSPVTDVTGARVLALLGDSVTTDHISPAGAIKQDSPAGKYLTEHGVERKDFNSYGSRRGNHEVMIRGTFANIRLRNLLLDDVQGGFTRELPGRRRADDDLRRLGRVRGGRGAAGRAGGQGVRVGLVA